MSPKRVPEPPQLLPTSGVHRAGRCPHPKVQPGAPSWGCGASPSTPDELPPPPPGTPVSLSPTWLCAGGIPSHSHCPSTGTPGGPPGSPLSPVVPVPSLGHHPGGLRRPLRRQAHQGAAGGRAPGGERRLHGALRRPADDHRYVPCRAAPCRAVPPRRGWHRSPAGSARLPSEPPGAGGSGNRKAARRFLRLRGAR